MLPQLLAPAFQALGSDCLHGAWKDYDWAPAIAMIAVFGIFLVELVATRTGASYLKRRGLRHHDPHHVRGNEVGHTGHGTHPPADTTTTALASSGTSVTQVEGAAAAVEANEVDLEAGEAKAHQRHDHGVLEEDDDLHESAVAQCIGVGILEIGVIFHSFIIGLTLAVSNNLGPLLAVLTFHQTFEGIGLGSRLSSLPLPHRLNWVPIVAAVVYSCTTPLGIAVGLGVRETCVSLPSLVLSRLTDAPFSLAATTPTRQPRASSAVFSTLAVPVSSSGQDSSNAWRTTLSSTAKVSRPPAWVRR